MSVQQLREAFARFLEADAAIELVHVSPSRARGQKQQRAASCPRLGFQRLDERTPDALATVRIIDDESADLRHRPVVFDCGSHLEMGEPNDLLTDIGDKDAVADDRQPLEPRDDGGRRDRVAELVEQARDSIRVARSSVADQRAWITTGVHGCPVMSVTIRPVASFGVTVSVDEVTETSE